MSDEQTTAETTEPETETQEQAPAQGTDWVKEARKWEDRAKSSNAELKALREKAQKLDEIEEAKKTAEQKQAEELEKLRAKLAEAEQAVAAKDREVLAERIAAEKGVKAKYLRGDTEEELVASADELLADFAPVQQERKPGVVPSAGTGDNRPPAPLLDDVRERAKRFAGK